MTVPSVARPPLRSSEAGSTPRVPTVELRRLDWDTAFFGALMGTLAIAQPGPTDDTAVRSAQIEDDLRTTLALASVEGYAHLILRVPAEDLAAAWAAERAGLRLVDSALDSSFSFGNTPLPATPAIPLREPRSADIPVLRELAADSFVLSRFSADPFFSPAQVRDFHGEWAKNLCNGLAQAIQVCELDGELAGFITCAMTGDEGRIPLIATRAGLRRRGVGRGLVSAALHWFAAADARIAFVKTQSINYPALALYHRAGFVVSKAELTFSAILSPTGSTRS